MLAMKGTPKSKSAASTVSTPSSVGSIAQLSPRMSLVIATFRLLTVWLATLGGHTLIGIK
jgi:hypothetical protein